MARALFFLFSLLLSLHLEILSCLCSAVSAKSNIIRIRSRLTRPTSILLHSGKRDNPTSRRSDLLPSALFPPVLGRRRPHSSRSPHRISGIDQTARKLAPSSSRSLGSTIGENKMMMPPVTVMPPWAHVESTRNTLTAVDDCVQRSSRSENTTRRSSD
jgi:hypothetical protein